MIAALCIVSAAGLAGLYAFVIRPVRRKRLAETSAPDPESGRPMNPNCNLPMPLEACVIHSREGKVIDYECGHQDTIEFQVDLYGKSACRKRKEMDPKWCADCLLAEVKKISIRCGLCGYVIMPGDEVALYVDDKKLFPHAAWKTLVEDQVVGCLRWDCCPSGGFLSGRWTPHGYKPLFKHGSMVGEAFATGKPVIHNSDD